ncbi:hypothetical protein BJ741DRAFT_297329 [Chytriomyces cf. hyalinus JEL632]|nr:hypothetical protein BJ741DRAFT_297329 [Chytriomyces cf. hyalinus JEL632]
MGAMNWPSSNPHISPYSSTPLLPGRATHPPHMQRVEPLRQYSVFGGAASAPNAIRHRPGPYQNVASGVRQEAKASTSRAKKTISAAHPPATSLPVAPLPPAHTYFNQPADYSHPFSDYLRTMQGLPADQAAMNRLHALASNPAFQPPFPMTSGIPFKADDNPDDNCPVCGVKIVGVLSKMDEERHLRICFGDEEPEPLPVPVVDVKHVSKRLRGSKNESVQGMTKSKDARPAAPPPLKLVGNTFVVRKCTKAGDECQICMEEFELSDSVAILNCFCVYHEQCIKDWFQTKEKKKEPKACPTHGE